MYPWTLHVDITKNVNYVQIYTYIESMSSTQSTKTYLYIYNIEMNVTL